MWFGILKYHVEEQRSELPKIDTSNIKIWNGISLWSNIYVLYCIKKVLSITNKNIGFWLLYKNGFEILIGVIYYYNSHAYEHVYVFTQTITKQYIQP